MGPKQWFAVLLFVVVLVGWKMLVRRIFRKKE
jgi:hypothetical protein